MAVLQSIAGHPNDVVRQAAWPARKAALQVEIDGYQAQSDALSAREQRAAVAGHTGSAPAAPTGRRSPETSCSSTRR